MTELKLSRPRLLPTGTVWGTLENNVVVPFLASNDGLLAHYEYQPDIPLLPAPTPKPRPKLTIV